MSDEKKIQANYVVPTVIEETPRGEREWSIFSRLLKDRIIFIGSPIDDFLANIVVAQLLFLDSDGPGKEISLYINSPGGSVTGGLAIYDTMQYSSCPITTICVGQAFSVAAIQSLSPGPSRPSTTLPGRPTTVTAPSPSRSKASTAAGCDAGPLGDGVTA